MSLILDAINRANHDGSNAIDANDLQALSSQPPAVDRPFIRWAIKGLTAVIITSAAYYYFQNTAIPTQAKSPIISLDTIKPKITQATITSTATVNDSSISTAANPSPPIEITASNNSLSNSIPNNEKLTPDTKNSKLAINALYQQQTSVAAIKQSPVKAIPAAIVEKIPAAIKEVEDIPIQVVEAVDPSLAILESIPLLSQLPSRFQQSIPNLEYSTHMYSDSGGFIILNGGTYKVGAQPSADLRVIAILQNSVVLDYQGRQFRLNALNSWLNFN